MVCWVHLKSISFRPDAYLLSIEGDTSHWLVHLKQTLTRDARRRLTTKYGLLLAAYVPERSYIESLTAETALRVDADPLVFAVEPYQAKFRTDPEAIGKREFVTKQRAHGDIRLVVTLFEDADLKAMHQRLGGTIFDDTPHGGSRDILLSVSRAEAEEEVQALASMHEVKWIEEQAEITDRTSDANAVMQSGVKGKTALWKRGLTGRGHVAHVIDTLPHASHCFFRPKLRWIFPLSTRLIKKIVAVRSKPRRGPDLHGTQVASVLAGDHFAKPGRDPDRGIAFDAQLTISDRSDIYNENNPVAGPDKTLLEYLEAGTADGARVHNLSWGDKDVVYGNLSRALDQFAWHNEDAVLVAANGNKRNNVVIPPTGSPANAKNCLCINGTETDAPECYADGGYGPTPDGRRKPDLCAPNNVNCASPIRYNPCRVVPKAGTSMAAPVVSGAAVLVRQYFLDGFYPSGKKGGKPRDPSGALVKAVLLNAAKEMTHEVHYPGDVAGWGVLSRLDDALYFKGDQRKLFVADIRHKDGLDTGESHVFKLKIKDDDEPLHVTLVWTDPPPSQAAKFPTVNKLMLLVTAPDGAKYLGNVFRGCESTTGGHPDRVNNVEMVKIKSPKKGKWAITVFGREINVVHPYDAQGFALVVTAAM